MNSLGAELYGSIPVGEHATTGEQRQTCRAQHGVPAEEVREMGQENSEREREPGSFDLDHHETFAELRALPDKEIERRHDVIMRSVGGASVGDVERQIRIGRAHAYRAILEHRQITRQGQRMEALTRSMDRLSWIVVLATIVGGGMTAWSLLVAGN